jgi:GNAT superfamily N-acetyltransferase
LFVEPELRGRGIGKALLKRLAEVALERGCSKMKWEVLDWNQPAIDFYNSLGAEFLDDWRIVRLEGEALLRLASAEMPDSGREPNGVSAGMNEAAE